MAFQLRIKNSAAAKKGEPAAMCSLCVDQQEGRQSPRLTAGVDIVIDPSPEEAAQTLERDPATDRVFSDGSVIPKGGVGGAAVLEQNGVIREHLRVHLGPSHLYTIFDGENTGLILVLELAQCARRIHCLLVCINSQAVLLALNSYAARAGHHLTDHALRQLHQLQRQHPRAHMTICWVPSHIGIPRNKVVD
ncbi:hypothetical protein BC628DRAFT_1338966 [Trametes gibbosa]|nr:hypothetical protein BC628DRAFT_1338966 [Trametes gibbosa]